MKTPCLLLFYLLVITTAAAAAAAASNEGTEKNNEPVVVVSPLGKLNGSLMTSRLGRQIFAFRGMRYAEPPIGQQRFKQAQPVKPWNGTFDASQEGPACPQPGIALQSEDCLRLNVYTTELTNASTSARPVIVFFHPGGFYGVSGQSTFAGPQYYLDQDIVLVTVNYRLASLGFMSTGDSLLPGNLGLKDQVQALRWVKENIASFGGNPNSVTITGYSAGSWSVVLHMLSPMSKGLFHRAIAMSGAPLYPTPLPNHQKHLAQKQAEILGCPTDTTGNMLVCLYSKPYEEFGESLRKFFEWHGDPILVWSPVVEPAIPDVERFLPGQPGDLIRQGKFHQVPFITGITKDEFGGVVVRPVEESRNGSNAIFDDINANWTKLAPISFLYERNTTRSSDISAELRNFYLNDRPVGVDNYQGLSKIYADSVIGFAVHRLVNLIAEYSSEPVYYYRFSYQGRYSHAMWADKKPYGVCHHDDLLYLFYVKWFPYFEADAPEIPTVERMTSMWANFAKTGHPIPEDKTIFTNVTWTTFTKQNQAYLDIGDELVMKDRLYDDRMKLWERLFPLPALD